ncbi:hypothetical protein [Thalassobacillus hwangdonensis]|uniref:Uncharacterized protein n=1 Tax=Thalassobacillus hwangdonensis TaxID=546108 RepID=A0ABW3L6J2_9BACI
MSKKIYKYGNVFIIISLVVIGLGALLIGQIIEVQFWQSFVNNVGTAILISGIFTGINEYYMKEKLVNLILSKLNLKEDINRTGIESVYHNIGEIDYGYHIKQAKSRIDIFHVYGRTWTNNHSDELTDRIINSNCKIRVVLLSPTSPYITALAKTYGITPDELKERVTEVSKTWESIYAKKNRKAKKATQGDIEVFYHDTNPAHSLYRIDNRVIVVQNKITQGKSKKLPSFICKDTSKPHDLYNYYVAELEDLVKSSNKYVLNKGE